MLVRGLLSPFLTQIQNTSLQRLVHISLNKQIKKCVSNMFFTRERERETETETETEIKVQIAIQIHAWREQPLF